MPHGFRLPLHKSQGTDAAENAGVSSNTHLTCAQSQIHRIACLLHARGESPGSRNASDDESCFLPEAYSLRRLARNDLATHGRAALIPG